MDSLVATLSRPEYTCEQRCWQCTVANGAILVAGCLAVALVSLPLALGALLAGTGTIWLRGYLVPYTPQLVSRLHTAMAREPPRPLTGSIAGIDREGDGERTTVALVEKGVIVPSGERLHLAESFRGDWREEMRRLRALPETSLVEAIEVATHETTVELLDVDRSLIVLTGPEGREAWVSRPVAIAETAAVTTLSTTAPASDDRHRLAAARALRGFLERCPVCETPTEETSPRRCCGSVRSTTALSGTVLVCPACNEALYRFPGE